MQSEVKDPDLLTLPARVKAVTSLYSVISRRKTRLLSSMHAVALTSLRASVRAHMFACACEPVLGAWPYLCVCYS